MTFYLKTDMAKFIWLNKEVYPHLCENKRGDIFSINYDSFAMAEFKRVFDLSGEYILRICADARYELYINGEFYGRGPASPGCDFLTEKMNYCYYDEYVITATSPVEIKAIVTMRHTAINEFTFGYPGVYIELFKNGEAVGGTDESWICRQLSERVGIYSTDYTVAPLPYYNAQAIPDIHNMKKSPLEHLTEERIYSEDFDKITVNGSKKSTTVLNFDKIYSAFPVISIKTDVKARVKIFSAEIDGIGGITEEIITDRDIVHSCQRMRSVGYLEITVEPLDNGNVEIDDIYLLYSHYPVKNETGFKCSDETVNRIYDVCMHTLKICRQNTHLDSPTHQEPLACTGDYYIQALMEYMNIYDPTLTAFDIFRTAQLLEIQKGRMFHTSYSLMFPIWVYDYYLYTGKTELLKYIKGAMECLFSLFDTYMSEENGLIEKAPDYMFVDWIVMKDAPDPYGDAREVMSHGRNEGFSLHHPPKVLGQAVLCMLYYKSLLCGKELFSLINDEKSADMCLKKAEKLKNAINEHLYDKEKGLYIGGLNTPDNVKGSPWLPENIERIFYLKQANTLAVLYGIAPKSERARILRYVAEDLRKEEMQPYFYHFLFEALNNEGLFGKYGIPLVKRYESLINKCDKGLCEAWEYINSDCSHAWGGSVAYILKKALSGFEMVEPGYKKIKLCPNLYSFDFADFEISTPYGPISLKLDKDGHKISAPKEIEVI